ncbi:MAG: hypothetical protein IT443_07695 [Phycisphaeraceae bacterium]|nr:hypothetical protein [Phycisphaeraceae bacterium]
MQSNEPIDKLIENVQKLDRQACIEHLRGFARPKLDFTEDFLSQLSLDRLRHVLMAACLQARQNQKSPLRPSA